MKKLLLFCFGAVCVNFFALATSSAEKVLAVKPENIRIQIPSSANASERFGALELQKHLQLITGVKAPIKTHFDKKEKVYIFHVGTKYPGDKKPLVQEESRFVVTASGTWLYGYDEFFRKSKSIIEQATNIYYSKTGSLFAVYDFLDKELQVRWPAPGDDNIVISKQKILHLQPVASNWIPRLKVRYLWASSYQKWFQKDINKKKNIPDFYKLSPKQAAEKFYQEAIWQRRMRMGRNVIYSHSHSFTRWWDRYGKTNPNFFALNKYGKREPLKDRTRIAMCVSNPELHRKIVDEWLKLREKYPHRFETINICENDTHAYCHCPNCKKLDVERPGDKPGEHLTDRYIFFANKILEIARKHQPGVQACMFAYLGYCQPPRKQKADKDIVFSIVPDIWKYNYESLDKYYKDWKKMGADKILLRPNTLHIDAGMPLGHEKSMFENYQIGIKNGIVGAAYDSIKSYWPFTGMVYYIMARALFDPSKPFEYWEQEYCDTFGNASEYMKKYFRYWRQNVWEKRIYPIRATLGKGYIRREIYKSKGRFYKDKDFDITDVILQKALKTNINLSERKRIEKLILANKHSRKLHNVIKSGKDPYLAVKALEVFRRKHRDELQVCWGRMILNENRSMILRADGLKDVKVIERLSGCCPFKKDPNNIGIQQKWYRLKYMQFMHKWPRIPIYQHWNEAPERLDLKNYKGIGWYGIPFHIPKAYKGKKIYLYFGAVDESCIVYVDGEKVGTRIFSKPDDWKTPFKIRIDQALNWNRKYGLVMVRVESKAGLGGIWKFVWLVTDNK